MEKAPPEFRAKHEQLKTLIDPASAQPIAKLIQDVYEFKVTKTGAHILFFRAGGIFSFDHTGRYPLVCMYGSIYSFYNALGGVDGPFGRPITDVVDLHDGSKCCITEGGHIHSLGNKAEPFPPEQCIAQYKPVAPVNPFGVRPGGMPPNFHQRWVELSTVRHHTGKTIVEVLGWPYELTDNSFGGKRYRFGGGYLVSLNNESMPYVMYGKICDLWKHLGDVESGWGRPLADEQALEGEEGRCSVMEGGHIHCIGGVARGASAETCSARYKPVGRAVSWNKMPAHFQRKWSALAVQISPVAQVSVVQLLTSTRDGLRDNEKRSGQTFSFWGGMLVSLDSNPNPGPVIPIEMLGAVAPSPSPYPNYNQGPYPGMGPASPPAAYATPGAGAGTGTGTGAGAGAGVPGYPPSPSPPQMHQTYNAYGDYQPGAGPPPMYTSPTYTPGGGAQPHNPDVKSYPFNAPGGGAGGVSPQVQTPGSGGGGFSPHTPGNGSLGGGGAPGSLGVGSGGGGGGGGGGINVSWDLIPPFAITGGIFTFWQRESGVPGKFGRPLCDEQDLGDGGRCQIFEGGHVHMYNGEARGMSPEGCTARYQPQGPPPPWSGVQALSNSGVSNSFGYNSQAVHHYQPNYGGGGGGGGGGAGGGGGGGNYPSTPAPNVYGPGPGYGGDAVAGEPPRSEPGCFTVFWKCFTGIDMEKAPEECGPATVFCMTNLQPGQHSGYCCHGCCHVHVG